jgi:hypothetical protein
MSEGTSLVPVEREDIWILLMSTIRYAMGRRSYMPGLAMDLVAKYRKYITPEQLNQIYDEISEEVKKYSAFGGTLGDPSDHQSWVDFVQAKDKT